jgi:hypothetical protein
VHPKTSIMVVRRHKAVTKLAAAVRRPMPGVLEALEKYFGEALPGGQRVFDLLADGLLRELDWLTAIDRDKFADEAAVETKRLGVHELTAALYAQLVSARDSIVGAFGRVQARKLIKGRVSRKPDDLRAQAGPVLAFLAQKARDGCPEAAGFRPQVHAQKLDDSSEALLKAQVAFQRQEVDLAITRQKWADAIDQLDDGCRSTIKTAEGLHELAGVDAGLGSFRKAIRKRAYEKRQADEAADSELQTSGSVADGDLSD